MLVRFSTSNFKSFKSLKELSMIAGPFKIHSDHLYREKEGFNILRTSAIYGANGSGKSNFIKSISFLQDLIVDGTLSINEKISVPYFKLDPSLRDTPSNFQIEFKEDNVMYQYFISILDDKIVEESLSEVYTIKKKKRIFSRETDKKGKNRIILDKDLINSPKDRYKLEIFEEELRPNQPFLTEGFNRRVKAFKAPYNWFNRTLNVVLPDYAFGGLIWKMATDKQFYNSANRLMRYANANIDELSLAKVDFDSLFSIDDENKKSDVLESLKKDRIARIRGKDGTFYDAYLNKFGEPEASKLVVKRRSKTGKTVEFELNEESHGTQRFIDLLPALIQTVYNGKVFIIDELNRSVHPMLIHEVMKEYLHTENKISKGQVIFSTHEASLLNLDIFRQDEIWFTELNPETGESDLYSLSDFKPRYDLDIKRGYMQGKFGAIPFLSQENNIFN